MLFILYHLRDSHASGTHVLRGLLFLYQKCATSHRKGDGEHGKTKKISQTPKRLWQHQETASQHEEHPQKDERDAW